MNKIYTLMNKSDVDWKSDVLYPITLFSVACLILLLSSFSTKASYETSNTFTAEVSSSEETSAIAADCCEKTASHTKACNGDANYVNYLQPSKKDNKGDNLTDSYFISSSSDMSRIECDDQIHFVANNLKANSGSGELIDGDVTYSGFTSTPTSDSPKANACISPNTGGWDNSDYDPLTNRINPIVISSGANELDIETGFNLLLDVSIVSFTGRYVEDRNLNTINWITSSEINTDYFLLERSIDNNEFEAITKLDAKQTASADALYKHDDSDIGSNGVYAYRVMQMSIDGSATYSEIVSIGVRRTQVSEPSIRVFPNPASDLVNVNIVKGESDVVSVKLFDLTGKVMTINNVNVIAGDNFATVQIPVDNLPKAAYISRINIGDQVFAKKITLIE